MTARKRGISQTDGESNAAAAAASHRSAARPAQHPHQEIHSRDSQAIKQSGVDVVRLRREAILREQGRTIAHRRRIDIVVARAAIPKRLPLRMRGCARSKRPSAMKVLSMESHRSRYFALNSGLISTAANRKTNSRSSAKMARRTLAFPPGRLDAGLIAALQAIELAVVAPTPAVYQIFGQ